MKVKFKINVAGTVHGLPDGVKVGDVLDVPGDIGARYCALHYADPVVDVKVEKAVVETPAEVRAGIVPEPEPEVAEPVKPRPGPKPRA